MNKLKAAFTRWGLFRRRLVNLAVGLGAVVAYELARAYYRPFIYAQGLNDFHLADTLGNSLGTLATVFVFVAVLGRGGWHDYFILRCVALAVAVYELAHPLLGKPIDGWDLVATALAGVVCEGAYRLLHGYPPLASAAPTTQSPA